MIHAHAQWSNLCAINLSFHRLKLCTSTSKNIWKRWFVFHNDKVHMWQWGKGVPIDKTYFWVETFFIFFARFSDENWFGSKKKWKTSIELRLQRRKANCLGIYKFNVLWYMTWFLTHTARRWNDPFCKGPSLKIQCVLVHSMIYETCFSTRFNNPFYMRGDFQSWGADNCGVANCNVYLN